MKAVPLAALAATAIAIALSLSACDDRPAAGAGSGSDACGEIQRPPVQGGEHLIGDREPPVEYSSVPPTSGWHSSGALQIAVRGEDDPLTEPEQVSVLEAGGVVAAHRDLDAQQRRELEALAAGEYSGRLAVTPYDRLEAGQVALTAWGVLQLCDAVDVEAIRAFADAHAGQATEAGH
ncbi:MAG TPA: DUF3105 domain-containing protein [Egibacteraceae bacterium]|nr:DUF3105 domain-containing protein [Egibacteraceae bacterium]